MSGLGDVAARARERHHSLQATVCDVLEPWDHGTVLRATRYPTYFDLNVVRVEEDPQMSVDALVAFADRALAGLDHRRVDIEPPDVGESLRAGFGARGWSTARLVWMLHEGSPPSPRMAVEEVAFDAVNALREAWFAEDFPGLELGDHLAEGREVAGILGAQVLAVMDAGTPVAYTQVERLHRSGEIAHVYVRRDHRGRGLGAALTCAAIEALRDVDELWIVADDEGRPKHLYSRLGFRPAWTAFEMLRLPDRSAS
jgi:ribosomal protein S18 acetylase RimI-like enzyme